MIKVDIVIPVYQGLEETKKCIHSVLQFTDLQKHRLIIINDASPDERISDFLAELKSENIITINNKTNIGFVQSVNKGMQYGLDNDVLLLNSDTEVAIRWLEKLILSAYSDEKIGTVTPFSNNATICSYPCINKENKLPIGHSIASVNLLVEDLFQKDVIDIPTGVGFCFYIKRKVLNKIGFFDEQSFGMGYGEEVDFCMRVLALGWRNVIALNTYVYHYGSVSFLDKRDELVVNSSKILKERYPKYEEMVQNFVLQDPLAEARFKIDLEKYRLSTKPAILLITHNMIGGTDRCVQEMACSWLEKGHHVFVMKPLGKKVFFYSAEDDDFAFFLHLSELPGLCMDLCRYVKIEFVHYHHLLGHDQMVRNIPVYLNCPYSIMIHDYYFICPRISLTYCGQYCLEKGEKHCAECLRKHPYEQTKDIMGWRNENLSFLKGADKITAPDDDVVIRFKKYFPSLTIHCVPHPQIKQGCFVQSYPQKKLRVGIIGAISKIKGADLLYACEKDRQRRDLPLQYIVLGYTYKQRARLVNGQLEITGEYREEELIELIKKKEIDIIFFPNQWPETFSYTLSYAILAGLPILTTDIGAVANRVKKDHIGWIIRMDMTASEINDELINIFHDTDAYREKRTNVRRVKLTQDFNLNDYYTMSEKKSTFYDKNPCLDKKKLFQYHAIKKKIRKYHRIIRILIRLKYLPVFREVYQFMGEPIKQKLKGYLYVDKGGKKTTKN